MWPDPGPDTSFLVRRCTELRRKPLAEFTVEDLRIMLGQEIGVPALLPLATEVLLRETLAEGDYYPGDLLRTVLRLQRTGLQTVLATLLDDQNEAVRKGAGSLLSTLPGTR
ncbi:hypothetical protein Nm8I071_02540 [Nonomuraea sp. TT08I-71]|nr:hypothetical protein Nm8I071_02540 [Nonomuraea sp. TT08I-71]